VSVPTLPRVLCDHLTASMYLLRLSAWVRRIGVSVMNVLHMWSSQVEAAFVVDRTPPVVQVTVVGGLFFYREGGVAAAVSSPNFTVAVTAADSLTSDGMSVQLQLRASGVTIRTLSDVLLLASAGGARTSTAQFSLLPEGEYVLEAQAQDGAGNTGPFAAAAVVVDSTPPRVQALQLAAFSRENVSEICVSVVDAASGLCSATAAVDQSLGASSIFQLARSRSTTVPGVTVFCGDLAWGTFQGNATVLLSATDPAGNQGTNTSWFVVDSVTTNPPLAFTRHPESNTCDTQS
jgi:hypothetical protein